MVIMLRFKPGMRNSSNTGSGSVLTKNRDWRAHPLAMTEVVTMELDHDAAAKSFVTVVKELHGISTFGDSEFEALEMTSEMIRGYIQSMEQRGMRIPLGEIELVELKHIVGL